MLLFSSRSIHLHYCFENALSLCSSIIMYSTSPFFQRCVISHISPFSKSSSSSKKKESFCILFSSAVTHLLLFFILKVIFNFFSNVTLENIKCAGLIYTGRSKQKQTLTLCLIFYYRFGEQRSCDPFQSSSFLLFLSICLIIWIKVSILYFFALFSNFYWTGTKIGGKYSSWWTKKD